jgi:hypothetical protein
MSNTYEYKVTDLQRAKDGIIVAASFSITASDGTDANTHNYHTAFTAPKGDVTPYANITESKVVEWIMAMFDTKDDDGVRQNAHEDQADAELAAFKKRKEVKTGTPWSA